MNRIIVNADDCGYSKRINAHIRNAIEKGQVTSATIIPNMSDFYGAVNLYEEFHDSVSFGIHLNLTEGEPLLSSPELLHYGFYKMENGRQYFNGKNFRYRLLPSNIKSAIKLELNAQVAKLLDSGVHISHIDSHHHIHTSPFILPIVLQVAKENNINRIRRAGDRFMHGSKLYRKFWMTELHHYNKQIMTTDHFLGLGDFFAIDDMPYVNSENSITELMIHPGGTYHPEEEHMLLEYNFDPNRFEMINYYML